MFCVLSTLGSFLLVSSLNTIFAISGVWAFEFLLDLIFQQTGLAIFGSEKNFSASTLCFFARFLRSTYLFAYPEIGFVEVFFWDIFSIDGSCDSWL